MVRVAVHTPKNVQKWDTGYSGEMVLDEGKIRRTLEDYHRVQRAAQARSRMQPYDPERVHQALPMETARGKATGPMDCGMDRGESDVLANESVDALLLIGKTLTELLVVVAELSIRVGRIARATENICSEITGHFDVVEGAQR
jgi:hypothetical protein